MRFVIDEIEVQMCVTYVTGRTAVGTIKSVWHNAQVPLIGQHYHVELDIYAPADAGISCLERSKRRCPSVHFDGQNVLFHGICEDIDETVYYVRFDLDWLEMIEINELAVLYTKGECMSFSASYYFIEIYPYTI